MYKKLWLLLILTLLLTGCSSIIIDNNENGNETTRTDLEVFRLLAGSENQDMEDLLKEFGKKENIDIQIEYAGTIDIIEMLNQDCSRYDGVWLSNSIWLSMLNDSGKIKNSKFISINPVVFGVSYSKAKELGFTNPDEMVYMRDIVTVVKNKELGFIMPSATQTNSGASAYLGFLACLKEEREGDFGMLTLEDLEDENLYKEVEELLKGVARFSGDESFAGEIFLTGSYDALVGYEASIINLNQELEQQGREPLYLVYPYDGVSLADSPFAYVDNGDENKQQQFEKIQSYLLSAEVQAVLAGLGRRTEYGGQIRNGDSQIFKAEWGIDTNKYLSPVKYPSADVIKAALNLYQDGLKKPSYVVFCLDYSSSMNGKGHRSLQEAMEYILDYDSASENFLQFSSKDKIDVIIFANEIRTTFSADNGRETTDLIKKIKDERPLGGTNIYMPIIEALSILDSVDSDEYSRSIILMTDGASNVSHYADVGRVYNEMGQDIPIFSIMFGDAVEEQLIPLAELTNGLVLDGDEDLIGAFKSVRGYN